MATHPIVVGYDASKGAHAALQWALDEGTRTGAAVSLIYAFEWPAAGGPIHLAESSWVNDGARKDAQQMMAAAVARARETHPACRSPERSSVAPPPWCSWTNPSRLT